MKKNKLVCPEHIIIVGGGRWAKVLLETIINLVPPHIELTLCSPRNCEALALWVQLCYPDANIQVLSNYPNLNESISYVVIIANAAKDHEVAAIWAASNRLPVLIEKPISLDSKSAIRLVRKFSEANVYLATAHVFLYASYIENFARVVRAKKEIEYIDVFWSDPKGEMRYGELKTFDAGVPIYVDWMPHILSILSTFTSDKVSVLDDINFFRGGAHIKLNLICGEIPCCVEMSRNYKSRERLIRVIADKKNIALDFNQEPGIVKEGDVILFDDPSWSCRPSPLTSLLSHFFSAAVDSKFDHRLENSIGVNASIIIDQITSVYKKAQYQWLKKRMVSSSAMDEDLNYALTELVQTHDSNMPTLLLKKINYLYVGLREILRNDDDLDIIRMDSVINLILESGKERLYT